MTSPTEVIPYQEDAPEGVIEFNVKQRALIKRMYASEGVSDDEFSVFLEVAKRSGLNPFSKQIYVISRGKGDNAKATIQVAIDGYRLIANRTQEHTGTRVWWARGDGIWLDIPVPDCEFAKAVVTRNGNEFEKVVSYSEYVQTKPVWGEGRRPVGEEPTEMWVKMRANQLGKCAEAGALRMAFPAEMSGIFVDSEEAALERVARSDEAKRLLAPPQRASAQQRVSAPASGTKARPESPPPEEAAAPVPSEDGTTPWAGFWNELAPEIKKLKRDGQNPKVGDIALALGLPEGSGMPALQGWYTEGGSVASEALEFALDALRGAGYE